MALVINSIAKCKELKDLSKYAVFFFYTPNTMSAADFRKKFGPLLKKVRTNRNFKCGQFSKDDVEIPRAAFGFESDHGVIFYRDGVYLTFMRNFDVDEFKRITENIDNEPYAKVGGITTRTITVDGKTIVITGNGAINVNICTS
ncbi:hypothetical protein IW140_005840 [Coemansia sp. RSA 1813]|nr:hypothetical protein EV178_002615 [Coemansia sp. RSA 1646]KAJ1767946.1 hypothetical protein LPJ74_005083 [Coemansia sp. RSA 1843]KAJ2086333.1 hypothetical protein IW138_005753 [Coemansia sp. RSA 986]KAJ2210984.1 hypothetical protein EV179_005825 [Coemansia sp. RSA 487]KAJ2564137.1 hypothetical protein IW140_005840 [Coemansia sp. RSA 1813]